MARYQSEATTAKELISCAVALIASQLIDYERIEGEDRFNCTAQSGSAERRPTSEFSAGRVGRARLRRAAMGLQRLLRSSRRGLPALAYYFAVSAIFSTIFPRVWRDAICSCALATSTRGITTETIGVIFPASINLASSSNTFA